MATQGPVNVEYIGSHAYTTALPAAQDPFRHSALANSHNHHDLHPWGDGIAKGTKEFDALYAEANNKYMYHLWYTPELAPYMATKVLCIVPVSDELLSHFAPVIKTLLASGIDEAIKSADGKAVLGVLQDIIAKNKISPSEKVFVRLSATSTKDSFALNVPTTKPDPLAPNAETIFRRFLTSGRVVGRLMSLSDKIWDQDPGEAIIFQQWAPAIELSREIRVFCCNGRITAISQDVWWEKMGWRERYSNGFVPAINDVWESAKKFLPFDTCTMDVFVTAPSAENPTWKAQIIEFNGFGAHLNTGSDLFHWVNDHNILYGKRPGITVRFVDDWEQNAPGEVVINSGQLDGSGPQAPISVDVDKPTTGEASQPSEPDWLVLEKKLRQKYSEASKDKERLEMEERTSLPLRGRWCSAY